MKSDRNILIAFLLNLAFSIFEAIGGFLTGSIAVLSDSVHDLGDSASIGLSYFLEKKSKKEPDENYTYGYARYSVLGGLLTTVILLIGSATVIMGSVFRLVSPRPVDYDGMMLFAAIGFAVNLCAAFFTREGDSINQKAVNLHMLEDVLGWAVVLVGAVVIKFTGLYIIDPILSIAVALFILINSIRNILDIMWIFLEKAPKGVDIENIRKEVCDVEGVIAMHHIHIRSIDGNRNYLTMHIVASGNHADVKRMVRERLHECGIAHSTLEMESEDEKCDSLHCHIEETHSNHHHHHHHH